jgi:hypothetical protein
MSGSVPKIRVETEQSFIPVKVKNSLNLSLNDFGFEIEFTIQVCERKFKIKEIPVTYHPRLHSKGKKITWLDGVMAIWYIIKFKLNNFL